MNNIIKKEMRKYIHTHMFSLYEIIIEIVFCAKVIIYRILMQVNRWPLAVNSYYQTNTSTFTQKKNAGSDSYSSVVLSSLWKTTHWWVIHRLRMRPLRIRISEKRLRLEIVCNPRHSVYRNDLIFQPTRTTCDSDRDFRSVGGQRRSHEGRWMSRNRGVSDRCHSECIKRWQWAYWKRWLSVGIING